MKPRDYTDIIIENLEGGYYHPNMKNKLKNGEKMGSSGETMFGLDRTNGVPAKREIWDKFWEVVDQYYSDKHSNIKFYNDKADGKNGISSEVGEQLRDLASREMWRRFEMFYKSPYSPGSVYLTNEELNYILTHPSICLNMLYAVWGGVDRFKTLAKVLHEALQTTQNEDEVWKALQLKRVEIGTTQAATNLEKAKTYMKENYQSGFNFGALALVICGVGIIYLMSKK